MGLESLKAGGIDANLHVSGGRKLIIWKMRGVQD